MHAFDVLDAWDGHSYGQSSQIVLGSVDCAVVSRYDSTFRRLAVCSGSELQLYRFGEYLPAADPTSIPPSSFRLSSFPNPFNPTTTISFSLPKAEAVTLKVYDLTGREVKVLADQNYPAGEHHVTFDGFALPSGIYFVHLRMEQTSTTTKMALIR